MTKRWAASVADRVDDLCVRGLIGWSDFWVQVLEFTGLDAAAANERVNFALLEANYSPEPVRRQLTFVDQSVERAWGKSQRGRCFFGGKPIAVCLSHVDHRNTISAPLSLITGVMDSDRSHEGVRP